MIPNYLNIFNYCSPLIYIRQKEKIAVEIAARRGILNTQVYSF